MVSLALYGAFVVRLGITTGVNVLTPLTFAALLVGANLPYWFSAMTMKSVGLAAAEMVQEVERQFKADPSLLDPNSTSTPDYDACVEISTKASLREMIAPAALVMLTPLVAGTFFGVEAVFGILTGGLVSGVQLAISMSNSGGAWDNAKKYISGGFDPDPALRKKDGNGNSTPAHDAAVTGDTVGDPFKDTSGPALNILIKLMSMVSLTIAPLLKTYDKHWEFYYWGFPPLGLFVVLTAALVYTGILTWEDPIGKMLDEGAKKTGEVASVVSNKEVELVA